MPGSVCVGTAAAVFREGKLLLLKRDGSHGAGQWSVPGGWLDKGELITEGAARELFEETGLRLEPKWDIGYTEDFHPEGVHDVCFWVLMEDDGESEPQIMEPDKCQEIRWFTYDEIEALPDEERFLPLNQRRVSSDWTHIWAEYGDD